MPSLDKYTDPELREQLKEEIHEGDKGGAPGQWSARKAQMMAAEYKKRGGGYTTDKKDKDKSQQHLDNWTEEEWQTKDGSGRAKKDDGTEQRYLPKKAWEQMSEKEKEETESKKQQGSREGRQHVENTSKAKEASKLARRTRGKGEDEDGGEDGGEDDEDESMKDMDDTTASKNETDDNNDDNNDNDNKNNDINNDKDNDNHNNHSKAKGAKDCSQHWENAAESKDEHALYRKFKGQDRMSGEEHSGDEEEASSERDGSEGAEDQGAVHNKRGRGVNQRGPSKRQKKSGGKDQARGPAGDKTRVPEVGQQVQWKSLPGFVDGEAIEVAYEEKTVDGKSVKGSQEDPRIVLKSSSSGKIAVHKPEAVYFD